MDGKNDCFSLQEISDFFKGLEGYYNYSNDDLARALISLKLLREENRKKEDNVLTFLKWSLTVSFLYMVNAWQCGVNQRF